jgi:AraC family transcriptional regulator
MNPRPTFQHKDAFQIVGVERYTENGIPSIQDAWDEFTKRSEEIQHISQPRICYGFEDYSRDFVIVPDRIPKYYYIAAWQVDRIADVPAGMVGKEVPASDCAVFEYRGPMEGIAKYFRYIYDEWLSSSAYQPDPKIQADFERYPEPLVDPQHWLVEIWLPVVKKEH